MRRLRYLHLDVFTERPFEGNQLAVFPEPGDLDAGAMQTITREMNFSESTFIFPAAADGNVRMRIFTPGCELPIAGHPVVGTTFALVEEGVIARGRTNVVYELNAGPTPVSLEWKGDRLDFVWMTQPLPVFGKTVDSRRALASAVGLDEGDLADAPVQEVSCGVPYLIVPVATRAAVDRVAVDRRGLLAVLNEAGLGELPVFAFTTEKASTPGPETVYSRMLAAGFGIVEDPATGSASGPLGCYLVRHGIVPAGEAAGILSLQGVSMLRPSRIFIDISSAQGAITQVRVGGRAVMAGRGELFL